MLSLSLEFEGTKAQIEKSFVVKEHFERAALGQGDHLRAPGRPVVLQVAGLVDDAQARRDLRVAAVGDVRRRAPPLRGGRADPARLLPAQPHDDRQVLRQLKDRNAAREWLQRAVEMPVATVDDEVALAAAEPRSPR